MRRSWLVAAAVSFVVWGLALSALGRAAASIDHSRAGSPDIELYAELANRVRMDESYYSTLLRQLQARGYPTQSAFNYRMPALTFLNARLGNAAARGLIACLGFLTIGLWLAVLYRHAPRVSAAGMPLLFFSTPVFLHPYAPHMHELWAGLCIAAALACWALGYRTLGSVFGAGGLLIREFTLVFVLVMAVCAWAECRRREAAAWLLIACAWAALFAAHARQVLAVMPPEGPSKDWLVLGGWAFVMASSQVNVLLFILPSWITALVIPPWLFGSWLWPGPLGRRLALVTAAYSGLFFLAGQPFNWYWGLLIAPLLPLGGLGWFLRPTEGLVRG